MGRSVDNTENPQMEQGNTPQVHTRTDENGLALRQAAAGTRPVPRDALHREMRLLAMLSVCRVGMRKRHIYIGVPPRRVFRAMARSCLTKGFRPKHRISPMGHVRVIPTEFLAQTDNRRTCVNESLGRICPRWKNPSLLIHQLPVLRIFRQSVSSRSGTRNNKTEVLSQILPWTPQYSLRNKCCFLLVEPTDLK